MRHHLFQVFASLTWFALYLSLVVLLGQIMEWVSAKYPRVPEDRALTDLRTRIEENRRQSRCRRLEAVYDEAQTILEEEKVSRIIAKLDDEAGQNFATEVNVAEAYLEYRAATDGKHVA